MKRLFKYGVKLTKVFYRIQICKCTKKKITLTKNQNIIKICTQRGFLNNDKSFDTIFNIDYGSGKSPLDERVKKSILNFPTSSSEKCNCVTLSPLMKFKWKYFNFHCSVWPLPIYLQIFFLDSSLTISWDIK